MAEAPSLLTAAAAHVCGELAALDAQLAALDGAQAGETKSSAGDKFETSREMMQQERDRLVAQRAVMLQHRTALEVAARTRSATAAESDVRVGLGSEVRLSDGGHYLIATGLGKVALPDGGKAWVISPESPLGAALVGMRVGEELVWRGKSARLMV